MRLSEAKLVDRKAVQALDPITLIGVIQVVIKVIEFCHKYRNEIGTIGRAILRLTGFDKKLEEIEQEAKQAIAHL